MPKPVLLVTEEAGKILCQRAGDSGMCIVGEGVSVLEAVGSWALYSEAVRVTCNPPDLHSRKFSVLEPKSPSRSG